MQASDRSASLAGDVSTTWSRVAALVSAVDASMEKWLVETYRLGLTEYRALTLISQASDKELRVNDLAQRVGQNPSSTTRLVSRLESKGLAHRDVCADDGRGVYAVIDEPGEALLREVRDPYAARITELLANSAAHFARLDAGSTAAALAEVASLVRP